MAVEGHRVRREYFVARRVRGTCFALLKSYEESTVFYSPDVCLEDARRNIPPISARRGFDPTLSLAVLLEVSRLVQVVDRSSYEEHEAAARSRIAHRDVDDWPIVATALLLDCPVWPEILHSSFAAIVFFLLFHREDLAN